MWDWGVESGTEGCEVLWEGSGVEDVDGWWGWKWERERDRGEGEGVSGGGFEG
jgi:hypothetical protein